MTDKEIIDKINNKECKGIYAYMYGSPFINTSNGKKRDKVIFIEKEHLKPNRVSFFYQWGWPGQDWNHYYFKDYGITWAFTKEEVKKVDSYEAPSLSYEDVTGKKSKEISKEILEQKDGFKKIEVGDYFYINGHKYIVVSRFEESAMNDLKSRIVLLPEKSEVFKR